MNTTLYFLNKRCPSCGGDNVVAMYEQCCSQNTGEWYAGCCGKLCLDCCWMEEASGRMSFPFYTGKYCSEYTIDLDSGEWDDDAVRLVKQMKHCDGDMDVAAAMRNAARRRREQAQQESARRAQEEANARRNAREEAERREQLRLQQIENERRQREWEAEQERRQREWEAEQERLRQKREAERRAREEAERQERLRKEEEARKERLRQEEAARARKAAYDRGDHERLMEEAENALDAGNYTLARAKAQQAWDIYPMVGLQYILACCADGLGERAEAVKWARDALNHYSKDVEYHHLELCKVLLNNANDAFRIIPCGQDLRKCYMLEDLRDEGLRHLAKCTFNMLFELTGGLRIMDSSFENDDETLSFAEDVARLVVERFPKDTSHRRLMLDCAFILTYQGAYQEAYDLYSEYAHGINYHLIGEAYDLHPNMGWCTYQLGQRNNAFAVWFKCLAMDLGQFHGPLDAFVRYGYADALLDVTNNHPNIRRELAIAQQYLNGEIPGSRYYSRCYNPWQRAIGIEPDEDTRWCYNGNDSWYLEIYTPDPSEAVREKAKGFFDKLFGR